MSCESSAGTQFSSNIIPFWGEKLGKISQNVLSAAAVIGALRVSIYIYTSFTHIIRSSKKMVYYIQSNEIHVQENIN